MSRFLKKKKKKLEQLHHILLTLPSIPKEIISCHVVMEAVSRWRNFSNPGKVGKTEMQTKPNGIFYKTHKSTSGTQ